ncbi:MAG TPA: hypothetical protein VE011_04195 [Candidatus Dormibacteraeota bacterium]|nr:hypothetical protein [Candidatus Dormibacteraeota bacterium]
MKRTIAILLAVLGAVTVAGVLVTLTRTGSLQSGLRRLDPRRTVGQEIADDLDDAARSAANELQA